MCVCDDRTVGGHVTNLLHDLNTNRSAADIGLQLNGNKRELSTDDSEVIHLVHDSAPGVKHVQCSQSMLLGALTGSHDAATDAVLNDKLLVLGRLVNRLSELNTHDAPFY